MAPNAFRPPSIQPPPPYTHQHCKYTTPHPPTHTNIVNVHQHKKTKNKRGTYRNIHGISISKTTRPAQGGAGKAVVVPDLIAPERVCCLLVLLEQFSD